MNLSVSSLDAETRTAVMRALEQRAIFKTVDGEVLCACYSGSGWKCWPLLGGEPVFLDKEFATCTCNNGLCKHIVALKHGGDASAKPYDYRPLKRKKLGKWFVHKHDGNRR